MSNSSVRAAAEELSDKQDHKTAPGDDVNSDGSFNMTTRVKCLKKNTEIGFKQQRALNTLHHTCPLIIIVLLRVGYRKKYRSLHKNTLTN